PRNPLLPLRCARTFPALATDHRPERRELAGPRAREDSQAQEAPRPARLKAYAGPRSRHTSASGPRRSPRIGVVRPGYQHLACIEPDEPGIDRAPWAARQRQRPTLGGEIAQID